MVVVEGTPGVVEEEEEGGVVVLEEGAELIEEGGWASSSAVVVRLRCAMWTCNLGSARKEKDGKDGGMKKTQLSKLTRNM